MAATVELRSPVTIFGKGEYNELENYVLMNSPVLVTSLAVFYLLFVLKIGPKFMENRKPFQLKYVLILYNLVQVVFSAYIVKELFTYVWQTELIPSKCYINDPSLRPQILSCIHLYFIAKVSELLDTVFFVLRKKNNQVTFLHVYHHTLMMYGTWLFLKYTPSGDVLFIGGLNSLIHVFMYTYYGLSAMGPAIAKYLTWKKYITTIQLVQFVTVIVQFTYSQMFSPCPSSKGLIIFILSNGIFFIYLFSKFYIESYNKKKDVNANKKHN